MNEKEILEYNKRCAEFLDIVTEEPHWVEFNKFMPNSIAMSYGQRHHIEQLQFHSDWNWIMEMVEAIEKLKFNVRITIACITIENAFDNDSNLSPIYKFHSMQGEFESKKEAVVQAINQFLIWYEQNK